MPSPDSLRAFVLAAELGSFSAAARRLNKAQSAVSTAIANLEIDIGFPLFDRSTRSPTLTPEGRAMLPHANGILLGTREFMAKAGSMAEGTEDRLGLVVETGIDLLPVFAILETFSETFPTLSLELLSTGPNDTGALLKEGRADLGLMVEQEDYPAGFQFRGVGHSTIVRVCGRDHPLAACVRPTYADLRQYRQIILRSRYHHPHPVGDEAKSALVWQAESPGLIVELVLRGLGWTELPMPSVASHIADGTLRQLTSEFQQSDQLVGIDVVWTEQRALGQAGQWLRDRLLAVPQDRWLGRRSG
ncbi:LysR family transcriptional regulator [Roseovarius pelagicus]|uniref:LysR family transcriptional regulator n=1 Tax=Roseovarius pelagicus TaxID=2980108 RepID=A0ABY6DEU3_9RHOB|nr:LysR family transcriptional regulator [Roseovarius pelagicus]UXX84030.1 LysR family transcriptional regulator [Roseovarius pelagicus]